MIETELDTERKGLTDSEIDSKVESSLRFPCIVIRRGTEVSKNGLELMKTILTPVTGGRNRPETQNISVYLEGNSDTVDLLGITSESGFSALIEYIDLDSLVGFLNPNLRITGRNLLVLRG